LKRKDSEVSVSQLNLGWQWLHSPYHSAREWEEAKRKALAERKRNIGKRNTLTICRKCGKKIPVGHRIKHLKEKHKIAYSARQGLKKYFKREGR
jgi:hypothetical protein